MLSLNYTHIDRDQKMMKNVNVTEIKQWRSSVKHDGRAELSRNMGLRIGTLLQIVCMFKEAIIISPIHIFLLFD